VILEGDGPGELCRFSAPATQLYSPIQVGGMVVVRGSDDATIYVIDFKDCSLVTSFVLPSGCSYGATLSFADGIFYTGGGAFAPPVLFALEVATPWPQPSASPQQRYRSHAPAIRPTVPDDPAAFSVSQPARHHGPCVGHRLPRQIGLIGYSP